MTNLLTKPEDVHQIGIRQSALIEAATNLLPYREKMMEMMTLTESPIGKMITPMVVKATEGDTGVSEKTFHELKAVTKLILFFLTELEKLALK